MKKKVLISLASLFLCGMANAQVNNVNKDIMSDPDLQPITPSYVEGVYADGGWGANWFINVMGGVNAFVGNPVGCGDIYDRMMPDITASLGKWFTPYVGGRLTYEGLKMKDSYLNKVAFQNVHADFLYNISSHLRKDVQALPKWDVIPYVGIGLIRNSYNHHKPFAMSYGIMGRYRVAKRLHVTAEIGGSTTFRSFDGIGEDNKFGDNLLHASLGLNLTVGKVGWKHVIDAKPYISQNDILKSKILSLSEINEELSKRNLCNEAAVQEMKKILEIEGLINKYKLLTPCDEQEISTNPKNNYSGLNSLRERLRNRKWNGNPEDYRPAAKDGLDTMSVEAKAYLKLVAEGRACIGAPVMFFFKIRTADLLNQSQLANLRAIAKVIKKHNLYARVTGAADSMTGSVSTNKKLSAKRANYIAKLLVKAGVPEDRITKESMGGVDTYKTAETNRNTSVMLFTTKN